MISKNSDKSILNAIKSIYKETVKTVKFIWKLTRLNNCIKFNENWFLTILQLFQADTANFNRHLTGMGTCTKT
jgi:hypothetical protein